MPKLSTYIFCCIVLHNGNTHFYYNRMYLIYLNPKFLPDLYILLLISSVLFKDLLRSGFRHFDWKYTTRLRQYISCRFKKFCSNFLTMKYHWNKYFTTRNFVIMRIWRQHYVFKNFHLCISKLCSIKYVVKGSSTLQYI